MALLYAAVLIAAGNALSLALRADLPGWGPLAIVGAALAAGVFAWARRSARIRLRELGLQRRCAAPSATLGFAAGVALAVPALAVLWSPPVFGQAISYGPLREVPFEVLLVHLLVFMPLAVAIPEELAFRGVLLSLLRRAHGTGFAVFWSAVAFTLWHAVVVIATVSQTNLGSDATALRLGALGAYAAIFVGGLAFAAVRVATRSLAGPIVAHWTFNALILLGLRLL